MDSNGNSKICDFESSTYYSEEFEEDYSIDAFSSFSNQHVSVYTAPEMLQNFYKVEFSIDFWHLGILVYKMFTGEFPFLNKNSILNDDMPKLNYMKISVEAKEFLKNLLKRNKIERLGSRKNTKNVKQDVFFDQLNWDQLEKGEIEPPYKPILVKQI